MLAMEIREVLDRRQLLLGGLALSPFANVSFSLHAFAESSNKSQWFLSGARDSAGADYLVSMNIKGEMHFQLPVPERVHDSFYVASKRQALFFGRSPSRHFYVVDFNGQVVQQVVTAVENRHFCGHGVTDPEGKYLFTTENNFQKNIGCIGVYDISDNYRRVEECSAYGVGAHQLLMLSDGKTLVIANGGLIFDPNKPNQILNLDSFESSLVYIDTQTGQLLGEYKGLFAQDSLRHMAVDQNDRIYIGAQAHNDELNPLVFSHGGEDQLQAMIADELVWYAHEGYTASLAVAGNRLVVTSPRGNIVSVWDTQSRKLVAKDNLNDVAGLVVMDNGQLMASSGLGVLLDIDPSRGSFASSAYSNYVWDNHISPVVI